MSAILLKIGLSRIIVTVHQRKITRMMDESGAGEDEDVNMGEAGRIDSRANAASVSASGTEMGAGQDPAQACRAHRQAQEWMPKMTTRTSGWDHQAYLPQRSYSDIFVTRDQSIRFSLPLSKNC